MKYGTAIEITKLVKKNLAAAKGIITKILIKY
jgi:hypothetical protein